MLSNSFCVNNSNRSNMENRLASRRRVLQTLGVIGVGGAVGAWTVSAQSTIELEGGINGWVGVAPSDIEGQTNPTLSFEPGEDVTVTWTNIDGMGHNFAILNDNGEELVSSDIMTGEGETQTVEFTASEDMAEYLCQPHPDSMDGNIEIVGVDNEQEQEEEEGAQEPADHPFTKTQLAADLSDPMAIDTTPDGRVFYTTRGGNFSDDGENETEGTAEVGVIDPDTDDVTTALELDVYTGQEDGLQGIAFDPNFEENQWIYLYYSPPSDVVGNDPYNLLSRFKVRDSTIDPDCEVEILRVYTQRETCCHVGGDLEFGPEGDLYISTGDDSNPFESDGYTPIDERSGRASYDAQRTAANTADLRGKILRITPKDDGSYTIPEGNLFPEDEYAEEIEEGLVRPEIYVMGLRNPFRMVIDQETGVLYYADYGPDAGEWDENRGPLGMVEVSRITEPQNAGWPYFVGPNHAYIDGEFQDTEGDSDNEGDEEEPNITFESTGEPFDPENPINDSPNNTGLEELPPAQGATIWYPHDWESYLEAPDYADVPAEAPWPDIEGGAPMGGPLYRYENDFSDVSLPEEYDGKHFIAEWGANWIKTVEYDKNGGVAEIEDFMPGEELLSPMDLEIGPDGALYLMEWGEGYEATNSGIYRIEYDGSSTNEGEKDGESEE